MCIRDSSQHAAELHHATKSMMKIPYLYFIPSKHAVQTNTNVVIIRFVYFRHCSKHLRRSPIFAISKPYTTRRILPALARYFSNEYIFIFFTERANTLDRHTIGKLCVCVCVCVCVDSTGAVVGYGCGKRDAALCCASHA